MLIAICTLMGVGGLALDRNARPSLVALGVVALLACAFLAAGPLPR